MTKETGEWLTTEWIQGEYEVEGGYVRPAPGATFAHYDPFDYRRGGGSRLWQALQRLEVDDPQAIARFATEWGLLGLLHHDLLQFSYRYGPRSERYGAWTELRFGP